MKRSGAAALLTVVLSASSTRGSPCDTSQPEAGVLVRVPLGPADLGVIPEACPATSAELRGVGQILIAPEDFYGGITAGGAGRFRQMLSNVSWISLWIPGVEYRYLVNASIDAESLSVGAGSVGYHRAFQLSAATQIAPYARVLLPTESLPKYATRYGFEHGISGVWRIGKALEVAGGFGFPLLLSVNYPAVLALLTPTVATDMTFRPWRFLAVSGGTAVRITSGQGDPFESFDPRTSIRIYFWNGMLDLGAVFPIGGRDRTDVAASAALGVVTEKSH